MPSWELFIEGIGFWAPKLPGWAATRAILRGEAPVPRAPAPRPTPALLPQTERRRAPDTVAVALEVAASACAAAACAPAGVPSVFASTYGDLGVSDAMCEQLARSPLDTSPTRFHHSVHNAAAGYWAIATGCLEPYSALAAHQHTFGIGLVTAAMQVLEGARVLYVAYDIEARGLLATMAPSRGMLGAALLLAPEQTLRSRARLALQVDDGRANAPEAPATRARPENAALVDGNAMADCLALFEALADEVARSLTVTLGERSKLEVQLHPIHPCAR
ncbi:MAG TPA: beta-ketoacyl synthase chain length factor [Steroidobacteraceae bacterium]|nr:beta-ketoacyl synthase chain length factor [Steroidobacteraceae bacterium]